MTEPEQSNKQNGWKRTTLGNALPIRYGKARSEKHGLVREATAVYGSSGVIDTFTRSLTNGPTLIVGRKGTVGATYYSPEPCWPIDTVYFAEAEADKDLRFFKYLLDHLQLGKLDRSTAVPGLSRDDYNATDVSVPLLDEQHQIVAEIEKQFTRLEAGIAGLRRVQANLKRYRAAVLKAACEGKLVPTEAELQKSEVRGQKTKASFETGEALLARILTERRQNWQGRGQYKEPDACDFANLPQLPDGWIWTNLDAAIVSGPQNGVYLPHELYGRGHPIMRIDDYQDGWVRGIDDLNKVAADPLTATKYQLLSGDLVINRVNSLTHLGKCLVVRETHVGALFESNMMKAHLADCVKPRYVEFCLRSRDGRTRLTSGAKWAVNQASINQEDVKRTPIPLPPLAEQTRIVAEVERRLSVVEELEEVVSANRQRASRLRQSILQRAFCGQTSTDIGSSDPPR